MKKLISLISLSLLTSVAMAQMNVDEESYLQDQGDQVEGLSQWVDPFIGTENWGNTFPGVSMPFGMVKLGPDCGALGTNSGYEPDAYIKGFSHVHVNGAGGGPKYGNILVQPQVRWLVVDPCKYGSTRSHEFASPGYYTVWLKHYWTLVELTSTPKAGFHRYTFPPTETSKILIDLGSFLSGGRPYGEAQDLESAGIEILSPTEVAGYQGVSGGWNKCPEYKVYFYAVADRPSDSAGTFRESIIMHKTKKQENTGARVGAYLCFDTREEHVVQLKVGISFVSIEQAKANLEREIPHFDFDKTRKEAEHVWNEALGKVIIDTYNEDYLTMFYTAIYHSFLQPNDRTGENPDWNSGEPYYDDFYCIWDTFRSLHPLLTLLWEDKQVEIVRALIDIYRHTGWIPDARSGNYNGRVQGGSNADIVLADAYVKGLREGIDWETALEGMIKNGDQEPERPEFVGRGGLEQYKELGYVSTDHERAGTRTVEYGNCDWATAQVARGMGQDEVYEKFKDRADNWENLWNEDIESHGFKGFIWPRDSKGNWTNDPNHPEQEFTVFTGGTWPDFFYESHSWEYSLYEPQDVAGLVEICGGPQTFERRLDTFFIHDYFVVTNEPGFLTPCLYHWVGKPHKTADRVRQVVRDKYSTTRGGLPGNDDSGAMSSWLAFHMMGIFPNAGQDVYLICAPHVHKTTVKMSNGKTFVIEATNLSETNRYVQSATLNGEPLDQAWFRHTDIAGGGLLVLEMGPEVNDWGSKSLPPSMD